jgi:hypothetical protein
VLDEAAQRTSAPVDLYDGASGQWAASQFPRPRANLAAAVVGGQVLGAGGEGEVVDRVTPSATVDILDVATGDWTSASLSAPRWSFAAAAAGGHALFVDGETLARATDPPSDAVDIYDATTRQWTTATLSQARRVGGVAAVGSRVVFAGGVSGTVGPAADLVYSNVVDIYDAAADHWSTARLSRARMNLTPAVVGTQVLFAGGCCTGARTTAAPVTVAHGGAEQEQRPARGGDGGPARRVRGRRTRERALAAPPTFTTARRAPGRPSPSPRAVGASPVRA